MADIYWTYLFFFDESQYGIEKDISAGYGTRLQNIYLKPGIMDGFDGTVYLMKPLPVLPTKQFVERLPTTLYFLKIVYEND